MQLNLELTVLDACCGSRMFWFDKKDRRTVFVDIRQGVWARDLGTDKTKGRSPIIVHPTICASFTALPFLSEAFELVVFDPPHMTSVKAGQKRESIFSNSYGVLPREWQRMLTEGFKECFRVLRPGGILIFKWAEINIKLQPILLAAKPEKPLFGHRGGKSTHWCVFQKSRA